MRSESVTRWYTEMWLKKSPLSKNMQSETFFWQFLNSVIHKHRAYSYIRKTTVQICPQKKYHLQLSSYFYIANYCYWVCYEKTAIPKMILRFLRFLTNVFFFCVFGHQNITKSLLLCLDFSFTIPTELHLCNTTLIMKPKDHFFKAQQMEYIASSLWLP